MARDVQSKTSRRPSLVRLTAFALCCILVWCLICHDLSLPNWWVVSAPRKTPNLHYFALICSMLQWGRISSAASNQHSPIQKFCNLDAGTIRTYWNHWPRLFPMQPHPVALYRSILGPSWHLRHWCNAAAGDSPENSCSFCTQRGGVHQGYGNKECPKRAPDAQRISENSRWMMMMMDADWCRWQTPSPGELCCIRSSNGLEC